MHYTQFYKVGTPEELDYERHRTTSIDVMTGCVSAEGFEYKNDQFVEFLKTGLVEIPNLSFDHYHDFNSIAYKQANKKIKEFYFPDGITNNIETYQNCIRLKTDVYVRYRMNKKIKMLAEKSHGKTYHYRFNLDTQLNHIKYSLPLLWNVSGAAHADDVGYIFYNSKFPDSYSDLTRNSKEYEYIRMMAGLYANFAKFGDPLPDNKLRWKPVQAGEINFLDITMNGLQTGQSYFKNEEIFWNDLINEYIENV